MVEHAADMPPQFRGETLSNSDVIREVHNSFARSSPFIDETQRTATEDDDVYHFIAYGYPRSLMPRMLTLR